MPQVFKACCELVISRGTNRSCRAAPRLAEIINGLPLITSRFSGGFEAADTRRCQEGFGLWLGSCSCSRLCVKGAGQLPSTSYSCVSLLFSGRRDLEWFPSFSSGKSQTPVFHLCVSFDPSFSAGVERRTDGRERESFQGEGKVLPADGGCTCPEG